MSNEYYRQPYRNEHLYFLVCVYVFDSIVRVSVWLTFALHISEVRLGTAYFNTRSPDIIVNPGIRLVKCVKSACNIYSGDDPSLRWPAVHCPAPEPRRRTHHTPDKLPSTAWCLVPRRKRIGHCVEILRTRRVCFLWYGHEAELKFQLIVYVNEPINLISVSHSSPRPFPHAVSLFCFHSWR